MIFGPHKTIAEHSYVQLRLGICFVTQTGMLTPLAVFIYTRITHLTQACRTFSRSKLITTSWRNHLAICRILLCPEVFIEPQSSTNNMQMICTKCRAFGDFYRMQVPRTSSHCSFYQVCGELSTPACHWLPAIYG
jgi:hypothetical protein